MGLGTKPSEKRHILKVYLKRLLGSFTTLVLLAFSASKNSTQTSLERTLWAVLQLLRSIAAIASELQWGTVGRLRYYLA